jgi:hypothetical protein
LTAYGGVANSATQSATLHRFIAGPLPVFVCDECVELCNGVLEGTEFFDLLNADEARADQSYPAALAFLRGKPTDALIAYVERRKKSAERCRRILHQIERLLKSDVLVGWEFAFLKNSTTEALLRHRQQFERGVKRHEGTQRFAAIVLGERGQGARGGHA